MSESQSKTVQTPSGIEVVIKDAMTAGDFLDASDTPNGVEISKVQLSKRLMDVVIVSVNGSTEDIPTALRKLPLPDYIFLSKEVAKLIEPNFTKAKAQ